jgi:hypothetical protein
MTNIKINRTQEITLYSTVVNIYTTCYNIKIPAFAQSEYLWVAYDKNNTALTSISYAQH